MIPAFRTDGTLPPGEHVATWEEVCDRFGGNERRDLLLEGLARVLTELQRCGCAQAWIDGSFVTDKPEPGDFDGCWDATGVDLYALDPVLLDFAHPRQQQKAKYGGEMFAAEGDADTQGHSFREFFQQEDDLAKGIIMINLEASS